MQLQELLMSNIINKEQERSILTQLERLQQTYSINIYTAEFERLIIQITELLLNIAMYFYLNRLKKEIR